MVVPTRSSLNAAATGIATRGNTSGKCHIWLYPKTFDCKNITRSVSVRERRSSIKNNDH